MKRAPELTCCDDAAHLLPWFVNGTLSQADAVRVAAHLETCETCRRDAAEQNEVFKQLQAPEPVEHTATAGWRKLAQRLEASERSETSERSEREEATVSDSKGTGRRAVGNPVRWLAAAVVVQGLALGTIAGVQLLHAPSLDATASYRTMTSARAEAPSLRVAFMPTTTLAELQNLLRANHLVAVAGPSEAGIFTLASDSGAADKDTAPIVLARLRADPRVRFAEPLVAETPSR